MNYYVGIDFGGTGIKIGIINEEGKIIKKDSFVTDPNRPGHEIVAHIADCAKQVVEASDISMDDVLGVGVGSPGLLNPDTGQLKIVTNVPNLNDVYLAPGIEDHLGKPTFLDNDVNAMSLGEFYYGAGKEYKNVIALTVGTGVGGGIIIEGSLYRGTTFTAGEIGHMSIDRDGKYCPCGNYGCLERYVGKDGIVERFELYYSKGLPTIIEDYLEDGKVTPKAIAKAAAAGDELSIDVLRETGEILGKAISSLVNILNPEAIIIGGGISNAGDLLLKPVKSGMLKHAYAIPAQVVKVFKAKLGNDAGIVGSASLAVAGLSDK